MASGVRVVAALLAICLMASSSYSSVVQAAETDVPKDLAEFRALTRQIFLKEVELERFNLRYWLALNKTSRLKNWRFFAARETNDSCDMSEYIVGTSQRAGHQQHPDEISRNTLKRARATGIVGDTIGASGSTFELSANTLRFLKERNSEFGATTAMKTVKDMRAELSALIARRLRLIEDAKGYSPSEIEVARAEGTVLEDVDQVLSNEFIDINVHARSHGASENSFYALNATTSFVGMVKGIVALKAVERHSLNGPAQIWTLMQGGFIVLTPYASNIAGKIATRYQRKKLQRQLGCSAGPYVDKLKKDMEHLDQLLIAQKDNETLKERPIWNRFALEKEGVGKFLRSVQGEEERLREINKVAVEKEKEATLVGGAQIAGAILGLVSFYGVKDNEIRSNRLEMAGDICGTAGFATAVGNNLKGQLMGVLEQTKLSRENKLPYQRVQERLDRLAQFEQKLRKM